MSEEEESAITFETFRKFQRKEKKNEKLQELPEDFFKACVDWINSKEEEFEESGDSTLIRELENVKSIVSDIFERRRKKILILALHSVRSKKVSENLLPEEREFFEKTVKNLRNLEVNLLERVLKGKKPESADDEEDDEDEEEEESEEEGQKEGESREEEIKEDGKGGGKKNDVKTKEIGNEKKAEKVDVKTAENQVLVRITDAVEQFMGTDQEEYGPLEQGDIVTLPEDIAGLLIERDKAEKAGI